MMINCGRYWTHLLRAPKRPASRGAPDLMVTILVAESDRVTRIACSAEPVIAPHRAYGEPSWRAHASGRLALKSYHRRTAAQVNQQGHVAYPRSWRWSSTPRR
jgi:hypothetical protein